MTSRTEIQAAVREFIHQQFPAARQQGLGDDDSLLEQAIIDSLGVLEIVNFIESRYQMTLADDEIVADHFESITAISDLVEQKIKREDSAWTS